VVGGTGVEVPSVDLLVTRALPEEGVSSRLVEVEEHGDAGTGEECSSTLPCIRNRAGSSLTRASVM
jgi:hypothetical protein